MSITNSTSVSHQALASIPADYLHTATGGASSALLPNGEPNALLVGGPAPVTFPGPSTPATTFQDGAFAREYAQLELDQWVRNADMRATLQKAGWFDLRPAR